MKLRTMLMVGVTLAGTALAVFPALSATPDEIIAARRANQKRVGELTKSIDAAVKSNASTSALLDQVKEITERAKLIKGYFPVGTETGDTKAKAEIWTNRAGFDLAADRYVAEFDKLLAVTPGGDSAAFAAQFEKATATCGGCHREFRNR